MVKLCLKPDNIYLFKRIFIEFNYKVKKLVFYIKKLIFLYKINIKSNSSTHRKVSMRKLNFHNQDNLWTEVKSNWQLVSYFTFDPSYKLKRLSLRKFLKVVLEPRSRWEAKNLFKILVAIVANENLPKSVLNWFSMNIALLDLGYLIKLFLYKMLLFLHKQKSTKMNKNDKYRKIFVKDQGLTFLFLITLGLIGF